MDKSYIRKAVKKNKFVTINNRVFQDDRLSWKAKGLMGYILSRPEDWRVLVSDLVKRGKDGADAVRSGLKELEEFGYMSLRPIRDDKGRISYWERVVYEEPTENPDFDPSHNLDKVPDRENPDLVHPDPENPDLESPDPENPDLENPTLLSTKVLSTDQTNKRYTNRRVESNPRQQARTVAHAGRLYELLPGMDERYINYYVAVGELKPLTTKDEETE